MLVRVSSRWSVMKRGMLLCFVVRNWAGLRICLHVCISSPACPCRTYQLINAVCDTGLSLKSVLLWSAMILLDHSLSLHLTLDGALTTTATQLWTDLSRHSGPNGCLGFGPKRRPRAWKPELGHGCEQLLVVRHAEVPIARSSQLHHPRHMSFGCKTVT